MKDLLLRNIPEDTGKEFKLHCVEIGITMKEALLRLMALEVEKRILYCPINKKIEKKVEKKL